MAFPFYQSYQPFGYYYPQTYQQMPQVQAQQQQPQSNNTSGIIWVSGQQEAQMYPVAPNNAVALWENSGKVIYLKTADATGKPSLRIFDLVERTELTSNASAPQEDKLPDFATKDELTAILGEMKSITSEIEQMKGDLYGVAGRKRPAKKEVTEDE